MKIFVYDNGCHNIWCTEPDMMRLNDDDIIGQLSLLN